MSSSFLSLYGGEGDGVQGRDEPIIDLPSRSEVLKALTAGSKFDLIVVGGGLAGVSVARDASLQGADVLLVEPGYFGAHSVAWRENIAQVHANKPWMLASSLRDLRSAVEEFAPHLVSYRFYHDGASRGLGGRISSWLMRKMLRRDSDGIVIPDIDERLLIRELALAARQEGSLVLGAAVPAYVERDAEMGGFRVGMRDLLSGEVSEVHGRTLFVDPGFSQPLVSRLGTPVVKRELPSLPNITVVCRVEGASLGTGYESFILSNGMVVGVCELEPCVIEVSLHSVEERSAPEFVAEVVGDVCAAKGVRFVEELSRRRCGYPYGSRVQVLNRRDLFLADARVPWDVMQVSSQAVAKAVAAAPVRRMRRPLPGEWKPGERDDFVAAAREAGVRAETIERVLQRWKGRVRYISQFERGFEEVCKGVLRGEILLAVYSDNVTSLEDVVFGALALHTIPNWRSLVPAIAQALAATESLDPSGINVERLLAAM